MAKYVRVDGRNSSDSLAPQNSQAKVSVLSVEETAKVLGQSSSTIRRLMKVGKIATVRLSRRVMISVEAINDFLEKGMIPARE
jgi:excisionase family DNA binding protein